ncbi:MAG: MFS transporter [Geminicoccaceae bacterium]
MFAAIAPVGSLLFGLALLLLGHGLQGALLGVRADLEGFSSQATGIIMSAYFVGFVISLPFLPRLVRLIGHIRTFTALASLASSAILVHAMIIDPYIWFAMRLITGVCFAGLYMVVESWINERTTNATRGAVLSVYMIVSMTGIALGYQLFGLADPSSFVPFILASILISVALVPVALTRTLQPQPIETARLGIRDLYRLSPLGVVGMMIGGLTQGAHFGMAGVSAAGLGLNPLQIGTFLALSSYGAMVLQGPIGFLSDRFDRRIVLVGTAFLAACAALGVYVASSMGTRELFGASFLLGGVMMPLYALSIAHTNDHAQPEDLVEVATGLLLVFGFGASLGPAIAGLVMGWFGPAALFIHIAVLTTVLGVFGLIRMLARAPVPAEEQAPYVPMTRTSPVVFELDPRYEPEQPELPLEGQYRDQRRQDKPARRVRQAA